MIKINWNNVALLQNLAKHLSLVFPIVEFQETGLIAINSKMAEISVINVPFFINIPNNEGKITKNRAKMSTFVC